MNKWKLGSFALCVMLIALVFPVEAQQPAKIPRIGYLSGSSLSAAAVSVAAFQHGLRDLGYVEGKNIIIGWRQAEGKLNRNLAHAAELVGLKVDVIVAAGATEIRAAREATATVPIVMIRGGDPVGSGFVASLARPGGNITGLATLRPELSGKRLELLKEIVPKLSRVAVFASSGGSPSRRWMIASLASHNRAALAATASSTGWISVGELAITPKISLVAVCCSNDSFNSLNKRTFSSAITA